MTEISHARYCDLLDARRVTCGCNDWPRPCECCNAYADGLEAGYREGARALATHPSAETLRYVAPLIRDAIAAGVWPKGQGTEAVEHEIRAALAWLDRREL